MKIGILGGSFNPVHCGHAMMANYLSQYADVDEIWLMPSPLNPLKYDTLPVDFNLRLEMCRIVARKCYRVKVSDFEESLPRPNYTYLTLCKLKETYPEHIFKLIIGSDNWIHFDRWFNFEKIIEEFPIIIYPRPGYDIDEPLPENVVLLNDAPMAVISSTFIRNALKENKNLNYFLDPEVYNLCRKIY